MLNNEALIYLDTRAFENLYSSNPVAGIKKEHYLYLQILYSFRRYLQLLVNAYFSLPMYEVKCVLFK